MRRLTFGLLVPWVVALAVAATGVAQPPEGKDDRGGRPGGDNAPPGGRAGPGRRGGFQLGTVLPPFAREQLNLTDEQQEQIAALEKEVKAKLERILTAEQKRTLRSMRPPGAPRGAGDDQQGPGRKGRRPQGPPDGDRPDGPPPQKDRQDRPDGPPQKDRQDRPDDNEASAGGIQWFSTLESGRAEATRTGKPILLVSAAPHCAGVSGIW
jgi:hypothetical protein